MKISIIYKFLAMISPYIEVTLRQLYWKNVERIKKIKVVKIKKRTRTVPILKCNFDNIISWLKGNGVEKGSLLIVHSSYAVLECTGMEPQTIVEKLLELVGPSGTLAMPAIRKFKGDPGIAARTGFEEVPVCKYDTRKTKLSSGVLPYYLVLRDDSEVSRMPLNPMVAIGPLAKEMMAHNIDGNTPSPHGPNSAWKFCYDHNAIVVGLGATLEHYNTMIHVAEEGFGDWRWPDDVWYCEREFMVVDGDFEKKIKIRERKPYIGKKHFAEINLYHDLIKEGIVKEALIDNAVPVYIEKSKDLINYLRSKNMKGYPYFGNIKNK